MWFAIAETTTAAKTSLVVSDPNGTYLSENASLEPVRADRNMRFQGARRVFRSPYLAYLSPKTLPWGLSKCHSCLTLFILRARSSAVLLQPPVSRWNTA